MSRELSPDRNGTSVLTWFLAGACATGCVGAIDAQKGKPGGGDSPPPGGMTSTTTPGGAPTGSTGNPTTTPPAPASAGRLRLLTRSQFENSLQDLLGAGVTVGGTEGDVIADGFASVGATYTTVSPRGVEQYETAILGALQPLFADPARRIAVLGCTPAGATDQTCIRRFITDFGRRAWRRPLVAAEIERYTQLSLSAASTLKDVYQGLMHATSALLASPNFLYRVEIGAAAGTGPYRYTGWEMASRLSYFLWNTTPDAELLTAAESGKLVTPDGIRAQVTRLLSSPRARVGFADNFGREMTGLDALIDTPKDDARFTETLKTAMRAEMIHIFETRLEPGADLLDIYSTNKFFPNAELAAIYGITGVTGTAPVETALPANVPRAGILGTAAFLSINSKQDATAPTGRGKFVRENVLCQEIPDPPDNVDTNLKDPPAGVKLTLREHMDMHRTDPTCASCHALMDPIGYAFENFDWLGASRDKDNGKPVDTSGSLDGKPFANSLDLANQLRTLPKAQDCLLRNIFRYASGHKETPADQAELTTWNQRFEAGNHQLSSFLAEIAAGDGFRTVSPAP
jgi:hypothetical protein